MNISLLHLFCVCFFFSLILILVWYPSTTSATQLLITFIIENRNVLNFAFKRVFLFIFTKKIAMLLVGRCFYCLSCFLRFSFIYIFIFGFSYPVLANFHLLITLFCFFIKFVKIFSNFCCGLLLLMVFCFTTL